MTYRRVDSYELTNILIKQVNEFLEANNVTAIKKEISQVSNNDDILTSETYIIEYLV